MKKILMFTILAILCSGLVMATCHSVVEDNFYGTGLNTSMWSAYIKGSSSVVVGNDNLQLISLGGYTGSGVSLIKNLSMNGNYTIEFRWKGGNEHSSGDWGDGLYIHSLSSSRDNEYYGYPNNKFVRVLLGNSWFMTTLFVDVANSSVVQANTAPVIGSWIGLQNPNVWQTIKVFFNADTGNITVYVDGTQRINSVVPQSVMTSIGPEFKVEFYQSNFNTATTEYYDYVNVSTCQSNSGNGNSEAVPEISTKIFGVVALLIVAGLVGLVLWKK
jgi:hypothetical protein